MWKAGAKELAIMIGIFSGESNQSVSLDVMIFPRSIAS